MGRLPRVDAQTLFESTIARLRRHEGRYAEISRQTNFSYSTLVKLAQGHAPNPTVARLQDLIDALDLFEGVPKPRRIDTPEAAAVALGVPLAATPAGPDPASEPSAGQPAADVEQDPDASRIGPAEAVA